MPSDSVTVADPSSVQKILTFVGSTVGLGTNTQAHHEDLLSARAHEKRDQRIIDLRRERELRLRHHEDLGSRLSVTGRPDEALPDTVSSPSLLKSWFALSQSDISPRNFTRLQNAAIQFEGTAGVAASQTLYGAIRQFLTFWTAVKQGNQEPELYVANNGRLQAVWSHQNGWFLVIEFSGDDKVFWGMYQDEDILEGEKSSATITELAETLKALPSKPLRWRC